MRSGENGQTPLYLVPRYDTGQGHSLLNKTKTKQTSSVVCNQRKTKCHQTRIAHSSGIFTLDPGWDKILFPEATGFLHVLDRLFRKQHLALSTMGRKTGLQRGANNVVEEECAVDKKTKAGHLEPLE